MNPNSPFMQLIQSLNEGSLWLGLKIIFLLAFLLYIVFTVVIISQVHQMENTIKGGFEKQLGLLSWLHLGLAVIAFVWALVVL